MWIAHLRAFGILGSMLCLACSFEMGGAQDLQKRAAPIMELLTAGDTARIAALLHYPPSYTEKERAEDQAEVHRQLSFLLQRFGKISQVAPATERTETLDLGVTGGTTAYFESLGAFASADITYTAVFEHEGTGVVKIAFLKVADGWEPFKVSLCLPMSRPDARALWEEIRRKLTEQMADRDVEI